MKNKEKTNDIAILLLAGKGERCQKAIKGKKQFYKVFGKEMFLLPLEQLVLSKKFREIVLVVDKDDVDRVVSCVDNDSLLRKEKISVILGGATRNESVGNAIKALSKRRGDFFILIHDACRPLLEVEQIDLIMSKTYRADALTFVLPLKDSILREDKKGVEYLDRRNLYLVQTPQVFDYRKILAIYQEGYDSETTDDFAKAVDSGLKTLTLPGSSTLFKVTERDDIELLKMITAKKSKSTD